MISSKDFEAEFKRIIAQFAGIEQNNGAFIFATMYENWLRKKIGTDMENNVPNDYITSLSHFLNYRGTTNV
jgi:hypothetical protein